MAKTNEEYIKISGQQCPSCDSYETASLDQVSTDGGTAWYEVECKSCKATWQDIYTLTGYDNLIEG